MSPEQTVVVSASMKAPLRHRFTAFGGSVCAVLAMDAGEAEISDVVAEVYSFEAQLTRFDARSELSRFNAAAGPPVAVSPLLEALLRACLRAHDLSDGLVNAGVHKALVAAGYDRSIEQVLHRPSAVVAGEPCPVRALPDSLEVGHGWARLRPGSTIDLGGVGKGWLADRLCERFDNACVNLGGDLRARGDGPGGIGWLVGLCSGAVISVRDGGVASSGTVSRSWPGGHHLIDPRNGLPAAAEAIAVSVAAVDAFTAEVLAKAAILVGPRDAAVWLRSHGAVQQAALWKGEPGVLP